MQHIWVLIFAVLLRAAGIDSYCWQPGWNPKFIGPPKVRQIDLRTVQVSWQGLVAKIECADQFLVKYWQKNDPQNYVLSPLVPTSQFSIVLEVVPKVEYTFQAIAREDKGSVAGIEYNRSPDVDFKTSRVNAVIEPVVPDPAFETPVVSPPGDDLGKATPTNAIVLQDEDQGLGLSVEMIAIIIVCCVVLVLIIVGIIYKMACGKKVEELDEEDDDEDDEDSFEKEKLDV